MSDDDFEKKLSKARISLLNKEKMIFFCSVVMSLKHYVDNAVQTAATNGIDVKYNSEWFCKLDKDEREFIIAHEAMHIVLDHCTERRKGMDPKLWNQAGDYVINLMLTEAGLKMPKGGLLDRRFKNMSTLQVYRLLEQDQQKGKPQPQPNMAGGLPMDDLEEASNSEEVEQIKQHVEEIVMRAKIQCEMAGKPPGELGPDLDRLFAKLTEPMIPWQRYLRRFFNEMVKTDYTWSRPNRRYIADDIYLPSMNGHKLGRIDFAIDTSGSISDEVFTYFLSEIAFVLKAFKPESVGILQFDHRLRSKDVVTNVKSLLELKMKGGGGTQVQTTIEEFAKNGAQAMFILTDGYLNTHHIPDPGKPVIWCIFDNKSFIPAWGQVVHFNLPEAA